MQKYPIVFIGAGNVATNLAVALYEKQYPVVQVYSRTLQSAQVLGEKIHAPYTNRLQEIVPDADLYIFSVKDDVLPEALSQLPALNGLCVHTSGSVPMTIFRPHAEKYGAKKYGVLYPLQTFSKERKVDFSTIPICIEASNDSCLQLLEAVAHDLSGNVLQMDSDTRRYLHLSAVFACNFVNRMYDIGAEILQSNGLPFRLLLPLIEETAQKVHALAPFDAQTGPAVRFDNTIIGKHLSLLSFDNDLQEIYSLLSDNIHKRHL